MSIKDFTPTKETLEMEFDNPRMAYHFKLWLCEAGEQDYWEWMKFREDEEEGKITADFNYHRDPNKIIGEHKRGCDDEE